MILYAFSVFVYGRNKSCFFSECRCGRREEKYIYWKSLKAQIRRRDLYPIWTKDLLLCRIAVSLPRMQPYPKVLFFFTPYTDVLNYLVYIFLGQRWWPTVCTWPDSASLNSVSDAERLFRSRETTAWILSRDPHELLNDHLCPLNLTYRLEKG